MKAAQSLVNGDDLVNPKEANDLLINAIEAKLSILQNIQ